MRIYPAIRAQMGDWRYYIVRMKMREIAHEVQLAQDIYEDRTLSDAVQRTLGQKRVKTDIVGYLSRRPDRFFSSIMVVAMEGDPMWNPVEMDSNTLPKIFTTSSSLRDSFGVLSFGDEPKYYALDGQHRVAAIKQLVNKQTDEEAPRGFDDDLLSVIVVPREEHNVSDEEWMKRYRRLFSSLNRHAKPTDEDTSVIMDEDDLFAIVTRRLISEHEFFQAPGQERESFKVQTRGRNLKVGVPHFTTLQTLYAVNTILLSTSRRQRRGWSYDDESVEAIDKQIRPDEDYIDRYYEQLVNYWNAILSVLPDLRADPVKMRNHDISKDNPEWRQYRDHLLFWPIGQELFAKVARPVLDRAQLGDPPEVSAIEEAIRPLADIPWDLHNAPWRYLLLVPKTTEEDSWRIRNEDRKRTLDHAYHLLCWMIGLDPLNEGERRELRAHWEDLLIRPPTKEGAIDTMWQDIESIHAKIATDYEVMD